ncbi:carbon storage regulator [Caldinitratiruptor microaerophilus]|uniref:Translational regulator CsrA n=1 Tax=Caldinitratiruptor microaerophilus TaxID=671077 RepID=A0AA35G6Q8_9FIRM|nr:carbon storage regulator [Caldinitratiruptor microaerophilus]BDG61741.1 hypothetical protein caldi_28310 [Caldinitratiruptor microaerophilus]
MLVLSRRVDESILIGEGIEVRILQVRGAGASAVVRVGITAPPDVKVLRSEVVDAVRAENAVAARTSGAVGPDLHGVLLALLGAREGTPATRVESRLRHERPDQPDREPPTSPEPQPFREK